MFPAGQRFQNFQCNAVATESQFLILLKDLLFSIMHLAFSLIVILVSFLGITSTENTEGIADNGIFELYE